MDVLDRAVRFVVYRRAAGALSACGAPRPFRWRSEAFGEGSPRLGGGVIDPDGVGPLAERGRLSRPASGPASAASFDLRGLSPVPGNRGEALRGCPGVALGVGGESVGNLSDPS